MTNRFALPLALALCILCAVPAFAKDVVKIARLAGDVEVRHPDEEDGDWVAAEVDQKLMAGWELRTLSDGKAQLVFPKDNVVILKENSFVRIVELQKGGGALIESDKPGGLLVQLKNKLDRGATFKLTTPTAHAIVRGTEYGAQIIDTGDKDENDEPIYETEFYGYEGEVTIENETGSQILKADQTIRAAAGLIGVAIPSLPGVAGTFFDIITAGDIGEAAEEVIRDEVEDEIRERVKLPGLPF